MRLKELRKQKKMSQQQLAQYLNIAQGTYANYETERYEPTIQTLVQLADLYGVSMDYLIARNFKSVPYDKDNELSSIYAQLNRVNQGKVVGYAKSCLENQNEERYISKWS